MDNQVATVIRTTEKLHEFDESRIQHINLEGDYVSDAMQDYLSYLNPLRAVIIYAPMGSGKNTFNETYFCDYEENQIGKKLYVSNRISLDISVKQRLREKKGVYPNIEPRGLRDISSYGNIEVITYQSLAGKLSDSDWCVQFDCVVFDECHFLCADAMFNPNCGRLLYSIPRVFMNAKRIYMTATVNRVLPYIVDAECFLEANTRWKLRYSGNSKYARNFQRMIPYDKVLNELLCSEGHYAYDKPIPLVLEKRADYSYIDLRFIFDKSDIVEIVNASNYKSLVFVDNKNYGKELAEEIDADYIDSDTKDEPSASDNPNILEMIISNEKSERNIVSTSVLCNGINLKDPELKQIFIQCDDEDTLIQMIGRKRIEKGEKITVYILVPSKRKIYYRLDRARKIIGYINLSKNDNESFMRTLIKDSDMYNSLQGIIYMHNNCYKFDSMTEEMYKRCIINYENILTMLDDEHSVGYCKMICSWLGKEFCEDMLVVDYELRNSFLCWIESYVGRSLGEDEFEEFSNEFQRRAKEAYKSKYTGRDDRTDGYRALNNHFRKLNLDYCFMVKDRNYTLIRIDDSYKIEEQENVR